MANFRIFEILIFICVHSSTIYSFPKYCLLGKRGGIQQIVDVLCTGNFTTANILEQGILPEGCLLTIECRNKLSDKIANHFQFACRKGDWFPTKPECRTCGIPYKEIKPLIIGGEEANYAETPWHTAIYDRKRNNLLICGGTIITEYIVVSAAHCFHDDKTVLKQEAKHYLIVVGKTTRNITQKDNIFQETYEINEIRISSSIYIGAKNNYASDIALLIVKKKINFSNAVLPACVEWDSNELYLPEGTVGKVVGWGETSNGRPSNNLLTTNLRYVSYSACVKMVPNDNKAAVTADKFCGINETGSNVGVGDSGGGYTFIDSDTSLHYIRGIVSVRILSGINYTAIFTDISKHISWILKVKKEIECQELKDSSSCSTNRSCVIIRTSLDKDGSLSCRSRRPASGDLYLEVPNSCNLIASCKQGYTLVNHKLKRFQSVCRDGYWDPPIPRCEKACPALSEENMSITCIKDHKKIDCNTNAFPVGTKIIPECAPKHHPDQTTYVEIECLEGGNWSAPLPKCIFNIEDYGSSTINRDQKLVCGATKILGREICLLNNQKTDCTDPLYLRVLTAGGTLHYGYRKSENSMECSINLKLVSCEDWLFDLALGRNPTPARNTATTVSPEELDFECGIQGHTNQQPLIINGKPIAIESPWHVIVYQKSRSYEAICSGTIISHYAVITAAHCFFNEEESSFYNASDYVIAVGKVTPDYKTIDFDITEFYEVERIRREGYYGEQTNYRNDIAILQTSRKIIFSDRVRRICLYAKEKTFQFGVLLRVMSWKTDTNEYKYLKPSNFVYMTKNECMLILTEDLQPLLSEDKFCFYLANGTSLNDNDSGTGLTFFDGSSERHYLVGVASGGTTNNESFVGFATKISNFRNWIKDRLRVSVLNNKPVSFKSFVQQQLPMQ